MKVEKSIEISAAPEKIWPFLVDPTKIVMWFDTYKKCECTSEKHSGVGTTYYIEEKVPGPLRKINLEVKIYDENEKLMLKMISGKNVNTYEIRWNLELAQPGTKFHFVEDIGMPFGIIGKVLGVMGQRTADKMVESMLIKLKNLSEE
ncbi:MAG: SRPBCC family protein [Desulfobacteraceae bacterium]|nr:SRPBCC family protein [Desulfobacteraceae bacterium]